MGISLHPFWARMILDNKLRRMNLQFPKLRWSDLSLPNSWSEKFISILRDSSMSILVLAQIFSNTSILNCRQEACGMLYYDVQPNRKSRKKSMVLYCKTSVVLLHVEKCYQDEFSTLNLKWTAFLSKYIQDWVPNIMEKTRPAPCICIYS